MVTTFQDIFKSSFLENVNAIGVFDMVLAMSLAFCVGLFFSSSIRRATPASCTRHPSG